MLPATAGRRETGLAAIADHYRSDAVRSRMGEYCGGDLREPASLSALSFAAYGGARGLQEPDGAPSEVPADSLSRLLEEGADLCRSLADRVGTLLHLDVDYANHDDPAEPYRDPQRTFRRLEPVFAAAREAFETCGVRPLVLMTGRGYHFVAKAVHGTPLHSLLVAIGSPGSALQARYERLAAATGRPLVEDGRAHDGAGRLLEFLAHEVMRELAGRTEVPVTLIDMAPPAGGPFVCLDLTAYADPLLSRNVRCPFSSNQKPLLLGLPVEPGYVFMVPRDGEPLGDLLHARQEVRSAGELAARSDARIPPALGGARWESGYVGSALHQFHRYLDCGPEVDPAQWPATYDSLDLGTLPACAAYPLAQPNPALLTPAWLYTVALALWAQGWHPRSIAALVRSRYEQAHGWREYWERYDPEGRARFYIRVTCGAVAAGLERREGFTCEAQRARGLCPSGGCGFDLRRLWETPRPPWGGAP